MNSKPFDIAIIGGGIIGTATAMALLEKRALSLVVLEAEDRLASHQTGRNSGVIHSGLYYTPGSLKAKNCAQGREAMYRFCEESGIAHERCGKIVVATRESEIPALRTLLRRPPPSRSTTPVLSASDFKRPRALPLVTTAVFHVRDPRLRGSVFSR